LNFPILDVGVAGFYPWGTMPKRSSTGRLARPQPTGQADRR